MKVALRMPKELGVRLTPCQSRTFPCENTSGIDHSISIQLFGMAAHRHPQALPILGLRQDHAVDHMNDAV
jgi:hypothetical protein